MQWLVIIEVSLRKYYTEHVQVAINCHYYVISAGWCMCSELVINHRAMYIYIYSPNHKAI